MAVNKDTYYSILKELGKGVELVAVSKIQPIQSIQALYNLGHRDFGENYVQELIDKAEKLPKDIRWHFIGHLQSNKVKFIAPFIYLIHGVDSLKLLKEINKQAEKNNRNIHVLLQVHIAKEDTKFGLNEIELDEIISKVQEDDYKNITVKGLMGMATFTDDTQKVNSEFKYLQTLFNKYSAISHPSFKGSILSMGMSDDYKIALQNGSTMVRLGSLVFGRRPVI